MHLANLLTAGALALSCAVPVHAGRPLQTDDSGVVKQGACELEAAAARDRASGMSGRLLTAQFACGVPAATEVAAAFVRRHGEGNVSQAVDLGAKTVLSSGALAVSYGFAWAKEAPSSWQPAAARVSLVHSRGLSQGVVLHANLGHQRHRQGRYRATTWGLAIEHAGQGGLSPMAELIGDDHDAPFWNVGLRWVPVSDSLSVDLSYGQQLASGRPRVLAVGLTQAF